MKRATITLAVLCLACLQFTPSQAAETYRDGEILIQLTPGAAVSQLPESLRLADGRLLAWEPSRIVSPPLRIWLMRFDPKGVEHETVLRAAHSLALVAVAQSNHKVHLRSTLPNDPNLSSQWHHLNAGGAGATADADIDTDEAWDITTGGTTASGDEVVVCIIEGADLTHPDLSANAWINAAEIDGNSIDDDANGYTDDYLGWNVNSLDDNVYSGSHGTQVAGMIGAKGDNATGVVGANWDVKMMIVAGHSATDEASVLAAYTYPLVMRRLYDQSGGAEGAFVVATNASWGLDGGDPASAPLWCAMYDTLGDAGILNCGATSNSNVDVDVVGDLPTACPSDFMVSVTATDDEDNRTFSAFGLTTIDLGAPGDNVYTTSAGGGYGFTSGTSFASPLTAGVIGLLYSIPCSGFAAFANSDPRGAALAVRQALLNGVDVGGNLPGQTVTGGRLNAFNSINLLMAAYGCTTAGLCLKPSGLSVNAADDDSIDIQWDSASAALNYVLRYRVLGAATWTTDTVSNTGFSIGGLSTCTQYEVQVASICDSSVSSFTGSGTAVTAGCTCSQSIYCASQGNDAGEEWISQVTVGALSNSSGTSAGYEDFTALTFPPIVSGTAQSVSLTPSFAAGTFPEYFRIWIDYNRNLSFDDPGELVFDPATSTTATITGTFTIPAATASGAARMRVSMKWNAVPGSCEAFSYGEVEDYCIDITDQTAVCAIPTAITTTNIAYTTARLQWNGFVGADHYRIRGRQFGAGAFVSVTVAGTGIDVNGLSQATAYEWEVMAFCDPAETDSSGWSGPVGFTTLLCPDPSPASTINITTNSARLSWTAAAGASGYRLQGRQVGSSSVVSLSLGAVNAFMDASGLSSSTGYEWHVASICTTVLSNFTAPQSFSTLPLSVASSKVGAASSIEIAPNPASGQVTIHVSGVGDGQLRIFDNAGRLIQGFSDVQSSVTLDISEWSAGMYRVVWADAWQVLQRPLLVNGQ